MNSLVEQRVAALNMNKELAMKARASGRPFTPEETKEIADNFQKAEALAESIALMNKIDAETPIPAPTLTDGAPVKNFATLRSLDGKEHRVFKPGQPMAASYGQGDMTLEELGEGLAAMITGDTSRHRAEVRQLSSNVNSAGGILITEELSSQIVDLARDKSVMMAAGAQTVQMASSDLRIVRHLTDPTVSEVGEGQAITPSDPSFDSILLVAKKLGTITSVTNELLADAANAGTAIIDSISASMAAAMDEFVLAKLLASTQIGTEAGVGNIAYTDLLAARLAVVLLNGEAPTIVCNPNLPYDLSLLTEATTNATLAPPPQLSDLRYITSNRVDADTAIVGDFSKVIVGMRQGVTLALSTEADDAFSKDITYMRALMRLDANVLRPHFRILAGIS